MSRPNYFICAGRSRGALVDLEHYVELTGRTRKQRRPASTYFSGTDREYRCATCGHLGWSSHVELPIVAARIVPPQPALPKLFSLGQHDCDQEGEQPERDHDAESLHPGR